MHGDNFAEIDHKVFVIMETYPATWRFCPVIGKTPLGEAWQDKPKPIDHIYTPGVGLILGPHSGGVMALDFDGEEAWSFIENTIGITELPDTVAWTSHRPHRMQMAYNVPEEAWGIIRTRKAKGLELRWAGGQSVLPPSPHPDTGGRYSWVNDPANTRVADIPIALLEWWVREVNRPPPPAPPTPHPKLGDKMDEALAIIKLHNPRPSYPDWQKIAYAMASELGVPEAKHVMRWWFPAEEEGEYDRLFTFSTGYQETRSPKAGSIVYLTRQYDPDFIPGRQGGEKYKLRNALLALSTRKK
jgi:hypothetical protein